MDLLCSVQNDRMLDHEIMIGGTSMAEQEHGQAPFTIFLNSRKKEVPTREQSYQSLVELYAGGTPPADAKYTVTYELNEHTPTNELFATSNPIHIQDGKTRVVVEETGRS